MRQATSRNVSLLTRHPGILRMVLVGVAAPLVACGSVDARQQDTWRTDFSRTRVPLEEIVSGGPPKDGIPAIDEPRFVSVRDARRWLNDREPVIVIELGAQARAYPLQILMWHEIVNDVIEGIPIAVTFCPLCNTALSFDRRFDGQVLDFGTTGRLRHSDLVMYDRQTETWWQQATGEGLVGEYAGRQLTFIPSPLISWREFQAAYPDGRVLSRKTGFDRPYGENPYVRYDEEYSAPYRHFFSREIDRRLPAKERVVAVWTANASRAYPFSMLSERRVVHDQFAGRALAIFWSPETASALDAAAIALGRSIGATGVFERHLGDRRLTFEVATDDTFRDRQTGSTWNILGHAIAGPLRGSRLTPVEHGNHFWFAWAVFRPDTDIAR